MIIAGAASAPCGSCAHLVLALLVALSGLRIYLIYGNFRRLPIWGELGFQRTYLNWGYPGADGAGVALVITLFSRFGEPEAVDRGGMPVPLCAAFLLVGGARGPMVGSALSSAWWRSPSDRRRSCPGRIEASAGQLVGLALVLAGAAAYVSWLIATGRANSPLPSWSTRLVRPRGTRPKALPLADLLTAASACGSTHPGSARVLQLGLTRSTMAGGARRPSPNVVLQILAELGVVGLILFGAFTWSGLRHASLQRLREIR